jgi:hypothetical protein
VSFEKYTKIRWVAQRDSRVVNALYGLLFWKGAPGVAEVELGPMAQIQNNVDDLHAHYLTVWLRKLHEQGPVVANKYVEDMAKLRDSARETVTSLIADANQINQAIAGEISRAIVVLARVKLVSTVGVALLGGAGSITLAGGAAKLVAGGVSLAYSTSCKLADNWEQGSSAKAVAVAPDVGKAVAGELMGELADRARNQGLANMSRAEQILRSAEGLIRQYSERLAQEGLRKAQVAKAHSIIGRQTAKQVEQLAVHELAARTAVLAKGAQIGIPLVFAAWDVWDGIDDYRKATQGQ